MGARVKELLLIGAVIAAAVKFGGVGSGPSAGRGLPAEADRALLEYRKAVANSFARASEKIAKGELATDFDCGRFLEEELAAARAAAFRPISKRLASIKDLKPEEWKPRAVSLTRQIADAFKAH